MKIHEYQAKELFKEYNILIPKGKLALTVEEAAGIAEEIKLPVIKAQVHSGARGKAGGIKIAETFAEVRDFSGQILGMELKSSQTGGEVKKVSKILVEEAVSIDKELYLSITIDRSKECVVLIISPSGGMDIEEVALKTPELIYKLDADINSGIVPDSLNSLIDNFNLNQHLQEQFKNIILNLYRLFTEKDCSLAEINPLVITKDSKIVALDGKINFDDNALLRHPEIVALRDITEENPLELEASKYNLNYIKLDGSVGCMVNGAGLAMATMDIVKLAGFEPANFLDVGGSAGSENIENAFKILLSDKNVKLVFINIFGGILRCDILAEGIKKAAVNLKIEIPVIVRLEGTNSGIGKEILQDSELQFIIADSLENAVNLIKSQSGVTK